MNHLNIEYYICLALHAINTYVYIYTYVIITSQQLKIVDGTALSKRHPHPAGSMASSDKSSLVTFHQNTMASEIIPKYSWVVIIIPYHNTTQTKQPGSCHFFHCSNGVHPEINQSNEQ